MCVDSAIELNGDFKQLQQDANTTVSQLSELIARVKVDALVVSATAKKVIAVTRSKSEIQMIPYEKAFGKDFEDMQRRVPSLEKIKAFTDFEPKTDLDGILEQVVNYMQQIN